MRLKLKPCTVQLAEAFIVYNILGTSKFIINDVLKDTHMALASTNYCCHYSFVLSTVILYSSGCKVPAC